MIAIHAVTAVEAAELNLERTVVRAPVRGIVGQKNVETGQIIQAGQPVLAVVAIDGLWGLKFGNGAKAGDNDTLFFTAGPNDETNGLFGSLTASRRRDR